MNLKQKIIIILVLLAMLASSFMAGARITNQTSSVDYIAFAYVDTASPTLKPTERKICCFSID